MNWRQRLGALSVALMQASIIAVCVGFRRRARMLMR